MMKKRISTNRSMLGLLSFLFMLSLLSVGCGEQKQKEEDTKQFKEAQVEMDSTDLRSDTGEVHDALDVQAIVAEEPEEVAVLRKRFPAGGFEWKILDFIASSAPEVIVVLDKVPMEGEELSMDAEEQLENLVIIHSAFPFLEIDVQAHTTEASNGVARQAKKATSKARAVWVATKLSLKGIHSDKLSSTGMADHQLLPDYSGDDKRQKRIMAKISRPNDF